MGEITTRANEAFRDYETDGVPSSGFFQPLKSLIRALFGVIDTQVTAVVDEAEAAADAATAAATAAETAQAAAEAAAATGNVTINMFADLLFDATPGEEITVDQLGYLYARPRSEGLSPYSARNGTTKAGVPVELGEGVFLYDSQTGQSLAAYQGTYTPAIITTAASYAGKVVMPNPGLHPFGQPWSTVRDALDEYYNSSLRSQGSTSAGASYAMPVAGYDRLHALALADTGVALNVLAVINGRGSTGIFDLAPGSNAAEEEIANMVYAKAWADAQDPPVKLKQLSEGWVQGENDYINVSGARYKAALIARQRWKTAAARAIFGQTEEVIYFIDQRATGGRTAIGDVPEVLQAELELCIEMPDKFAFYGPSYDLKYADTLHLGSPGYHIRDLRNAETRYRHVFCGGSPPFCVTSAWWTSSTVIRCRVEVPVAPLVRDITFNSNTVTFDAGADTVGWTAHGLANGTVVYFSNSGGGLPPELSAGVRYYVVNTATDTFKVSATSGGSAIGLSTAGTGTHTAIVNGDGIQFDDGSGAPPYVTGISIVDTGDASGSGNDPGGRALIDVTLSGAPAATGRKRLLFGQLSAPSANPGTAGAARTTLRDSAAGTSAIDRDGAANTYNLYNWLARQEVILP